MDSSTPCTPAADYRTDAPSADGWTYKRQALFLVTLAHSGLVSKACREAGMSPTSAYMFRRRADGMVFALGWKAAVLLARDRLEDMLLEAAIAGVETVTTKVEGVTRRAERQQRINLLRNPPFMQATPSSGKSIVTISPCLAPERSIMNPMAGLKTIKTRHFYC